VQRTNLFRISLFTHSTLSEGYDRIDSFDKAYTAVARYHDPDRAPCPAPARGGWCPCSWTPQESQVERCEHQDDSNIHYQPFPESVSEEREIHTDYDGCHGHCVKRDSHLSAHFSYTTTTFGNRGICADARSFKARPDAPRSKLKAEAELRPRKRGSPLPGVAIKNLCA